MRPIPRFLAFAALAGGLVAPSLPADEVVVQDLAGLKQAIASDRTIVLEPGDYVSKQGLRFGHVQNLTIRGSDRVRTRILVSDDYADVLRFDEVTGLRIENLTLGHHPDLAYCVGGVLVLSKCRDVQIEEVTLFGSGVEGLSVHASQGVELAHSEIRECTSSVMSVVSSKDVLVRECVFRENEIWGALVNVHSSELRVEDTEITHSGETQVELLQLENVPYYTSHGDLEPTSQEKSRVTFLRGKIAGNMAVPRATQSGVRYEAVDFTDLVAQERPSGDGDESDAQTRAEACGCALLEKRVTDLEAENERLWRQFGELRDRVVGR